MKKNKTKGILLTEKVPVKHLLLIMRTTFILLFIAVFSSMASSGYTQSARVNINKRNVAIREVLNEIEKQTDYLFIYNNEVNTNEKVSIRANKNAVSDVLNSLLKDRSIDYTMEGNHIILSIAQPRAVAATSAIVQELQQKKQITGTVVDENGIAVIGANVIETGTSNGTVTDMDGQFSLQVADEAEIRISYIGYLDEVIQTQNMKSFQVRLREDTQALDELVVIGYGSMTRKDVTSSITTLSAEKLNIGVFSDPAQLLQGKVPGLIITQSSNPNGSPSITLRGASTFRGGAAQEPYYVIDGIPGVSLALVAPDDIESIDVLRDATATAIYGSKAANGVIIINTKKGRAGHTNINYSAYVAKDDILKNWDLMDGEQLRRYAIQNNITLINDLGANTDWQKEVQRTGLSHNHNVSINGGSEKVSYNSSINYMERQGVIKGTEMDRLTGRSFLEAKAMNDRLTLSFNVNSSVTNRQSVPFANQGQSVLDAMSYYSPLVPVREEDGYWYENSGIS